MRSCHRFQRRIYAEKREDVSIIENREKESTRV